ncbi:hypothetical protein E1292_44665 [Nonomuraea deserti]|uniref:Uncharacterized protein n=1 Tax=Nonomuraea deserti TaxID=1848322 RepID=A0A4V2Y6T7_9ACTN|nr:hypothetical protein [Nonomuraea deserti]TDC89285.1 hypothetical protein E1292_44665 [Nonomuraea deserti]
MELEFALGVLGVPWPTRDEDRLRQYAAAYRACARMLATNVIPTAHGAVLHAAANNSGAAMDAAGYFWAQYHQEGDDSVHMPSMVVTLKALAVIHEVAADLVKAYKELLIAAAEAVAALLAIAVLTAGLAPFSRVVRLRLVVARATGLFRPLLEGAICTSVRKAIESRLCRIALARSPQQSVVENASARTAEAHPLRGLWLASRYPAGADIDPFKFIMDLVDRGKAEGLMVATGKRFPGDYIAYRAKVENWLRAEGRKKGQECADNVYPLYFRLYTKPAGSLGEGFTTLNMRAESIPAEHMTFTLEDSFNNYMILDPPDGQTAFLDLEPRVFSAQEVRSLIDQDGFPEHLDGGSVKSYIEVQVWLRDAPVFDRARTLADTDRGQSSVITVGP